MNQRTAKLLEWLAKENEFVEAMKSDIGQEILAMMTNDCDEVLGKILNNLKNNKEDQGLQIEFRVLTRLISKYSHRIGEYYNQLERSKK